VAAVANPQGRPGRWPPLAAVGLVLAFVLLPSSGLTSAWAQPDDPSGPEFGIRPVYWADTDLPGGHFSYALEPGASVDDAIEILNFSDDPLRFDVYGADLVTAQGGGFAPAARELPSDGAGNWIVPERTVVEVAPHRSVEVAFTVSVPERTEPGDHPGAIVVERQTEPRQDAGITMQPRLAQRVLINVPGEVALGVELGELAVVRAGRQVRFELPVRNSGNVTFTTSGEVAVGAWGRRRVLALEPAGLYAVPGGEAVVTAVWEDPPWYGRATAVATLDVVVGDDAPVRFSTEEARLWLFWWPPVLLAVGLLMLALGLWRAPEPRRRLQRLAAERREDRAVLRDHRAERRARRHADDVTGRVERDEHPSHRASSR
jgi:hypothetical protein